MANIFTNFWYKINKKLVPRNSKVTETSSNFIIELQNANGSASTDRETLVSFSIPKGTSFTQQDRNDLAATLNAFTKVKNITDSQWTAIQNLSALETRVTTAETDIDSLENKTNATITANQATTTTPGYMTAAQVERLNATVTAPATSETAGYMSAEDKKAFDQIAAYSQQYAIFYNDGTTTSNPSTRLKNKQYVFKMNKISFNQTLAHIADENEDDGARIIIDKPGTYLILGTGTMSQATTEGNCLTIRLIHGNSETPVTINDDIVTGGTRRGSSNTFIYNSGWYNSGMVYNILNLTVGDEILLVGAVAKDITGTWIHQNSKLILFKMLEAKDFSGDKKGQIDDPTDPISEVTP